MDVREERRTERESARDFGVERERRVAPRGMAGAQSGAVRARESRAGEIAQARNLV